LTVFVLSSNGWDPYTTEIWGYAVTRKEAEEWVTKVKFQSDRWNGCNFDKKIKIEYEKELLKLGMVDAEGKYDDRYAGNPYYRETKKIFPTKHSQPKVKDEK